MTLADWQALASDLGLAAKVGTIADLLSLPEFGRALWGVPNDLDELAELAGVWGRMYAELARWWAVIIWSAQPAEIAIILRHMRALCAAGWYPDTLRRDPPPVSAAQVELDQAAAQALYKAWRADGQPCLALGFHTALVKLRAEAKAAAARAEQDTDMGRFVRELDAMNTRPIVPDQPFTADELMLSDPHSTT